MWEYKYDGDCPDYLIHHGILGMKWGVRRYQNKDGSLTAKGKERIKINRSDRKIIKNDKDYILKKGAVVQRISNNAEERMRDYAYVSFTKHDNNFYDKTFTEKLQFNDYTNTIYKHSFKTTKNLKVASSETSKEIFLEMYKERTSEMINNMANARRIADINYQPLTYKFRANNDVYKGDYTKAYADAAKFYIGRYSNMTVKQLQEDAYYDFINSISNDTKMRSAFFDKLKSKGYDAVLDDNDSAGLGARGYAEDERPNYPLIVFDTSNVLKRNDSSIVSKPMTKEEARKKLYGW